MKKVKVSILLLAVIAVMVGSALAAPVRLDSITVADSRNNSPARVAVDAQGSIYVSVPASNGVYKYNSAGQYLGFLSVPRPDGIAVDGSGRIYVCSTNYAAYPAKNAVFIYNADFSKAGALGIGEGEFAKPVDVALDATGRVYVVDTGAGVVKVFDAAGNFSFGAYGNANGQFNKPMGVAINEAAGEVYVTDKPDFRDANGTSIGARVQVFDKNGSFKRAFGKFGDSLAAGYVPFSLPFLSPAGIAVDLAGNLYVADSGQNVVLVLKPEDGSAVGSGGMYDPLKPGFNPSGVTTTRNGMAFVVYQKDEGVTGRVDKYGLDGYVTMAASPSALSFIGSQFAGNPAPQTVLISNAGVGTLNWSATADQAWIKLGKMDAAGPGGTVGLAVGVDISSFGIGSYSGSVTVDSGFGQKETIAVALTVIPAPSLNLSNGWLNFTAKRGKSPAAQTIVLSIDNIITGSQAWSLSSDASWLTVTPGSGTATPESSATTVTVAVNSGALTVGSYTGLLTINAPGVIGSGGKINVNLTVAPTSKVSVSTRADATFTVSGPSSFVPYTGAGPNWSMDDAPTGDYTVTFNALPGFRKPRTQTKTLVQDGSVVFSGDYASLQDLAARKNIVAAKGPAEKNDALVKAYSNTGATVVFDLAALETGFGANIAVGDIDNDGAAELIVGTGDGQNNAARVRVFRADRSLMLEFVPFGSLNGVHVSAGDLDGDGKAEIIVTPAPGSENAGTVAAFTYDPATGKMVSTGLGFASHPAPYGANVAVADIDGSGMPVIVTSAGIGRQSSAVVKIWKVDTARGAGSWTASSAKEITLSGSRGATIAAADVDGDGKDEIIAGTGGIAAGDAAIVTVIKADGTQSKFKTFDKSGVNVAAADLDGDGMAEIIAAQGLETPGDTKGQKMTKKRDSDDAQGTVRVYSAAGVLKFAITPFDESKEGVNVAVGELGL